MVFPGAQGGKHLNRAVQRRFGQGMRVHPNIQRPRDILPLAVFTNSLTDRQDVRLIKTVQEG